MRILLTLPLLVVLVVGYPYGIEEIDDKIVVSEDYYPQNLVIYEGEHDIVDIMVPLNRASMYNNLEDLNDTDPTNLKEHLMVFFVEADIKEDHREDHGIYMYRDGTVVKIMEEGRALAASADESEYVFFGAKDGLYIYNPETQKADKYGLFNNSVKDIAKEQNTDIIYILTDDRELYKVYDAATKMEKVDDIKDIEQIMLDYANNLYYYGKDSQVYVRTSEGKTKKINGLPEEPKAVKFLRPPIFNNEGVGVMADSEVYTIYPDGMTESENLEFMPEAKPTAYSMEAGIYRYFGFQKKIYEYDLLSMVDSSESIADFDVHPKLIVLLRR